MLSKLATLHSFQLYKTQPTYIDTSHTHLTSPKAKHFGEQVWHQQDWECFHNRNGGWPSSVSSVLLACPVVPSTGKVSGHKTRQHDLPQNIPIQKDAHEDAILVGNIGFSNTLSDYEYIHVNTMNWWIRMIVLSSVCNWACIYTWSKILRLL